MEKYYCAFFHTKKRIRERYGFSITFYDYLQMVKICENKKQILRLTHNSNTKSVLYILSFKERHLYVLFEEDTNIIVTCLSNKRGIFSIYSWSNKTETQLNIKKGK